MLVPLLVAAILAGWSAIAAAQTPYVPYYGKNNIHYDTFNWEIYTTDHFEIYYYPEMKQHLERVAGYAESAYQQISADLEERAAEQDPAHPVQDPQRVRAGKRRPVAPARKASARSPSRPACAWSCRSTLRPTSSTASSSTSSTHQFEFDIIPQGLIRRNVPLWVNEGLSEFERGQWTPLDLMTVRDAAVADIVPKMTETEDYGNASNARFVPYNLGHAVFEFIEAKFGREGIRQFMFALRKSVIGGGEDAYEDALKMKKDEFDQNFERYLKERFKPFRDKERPADYGRDLSPNKEKTSFAEAFSIAPSPSGDLIAAMTFNREDREIDIILISSKDGSIVRNLTKGFDKDMGFDHIVQLGERFEMPWMAWSPKGDRLAYFVRTAKERTLIIQNVLTRSIEQRIDDEDGGRAGVAVVLARRQDDRVCRAAQRGRRHLPRGSRDAEGHQPHRGRFRQLGPDLSRPTASSSSTTRASAATRSCSGSISTRRRRRSSPSARSMKRRRSSSTTTRWCSRRRPPIRTCRSSRTSPRTATSTTSGRSI